MNELEKLLMNESLKNDLKTVLVRAVDGFEVNQCFWAVRNIEGDFNNLSPEAKAVFNKEFAGLFYQVKWLAVPRLGPGEILDLLEKHLLITGEFEVGLFNLTQAYKDFIVKITLYEERDDFKIKTRQALLNNKEVIDSTISIKTIGDWLRNIISKVGMQITDRVKESEYYIRDENFTKLKKEDQNFIKEVISLYKYCLYSSQDPEGIDEHIPVVEDGKIKVIEKGQIMDVPPLDPDTLAVIEEIIDRSFAGQEEIQELRESYHQTLNNLIDKKRFNEGLVGSTQFQVIIDNLNSNLALKDLTMVMAGLKRLIDARGLGELLKSNYFIQPFVIYAEIQLGPAAKNLVSRLSPEVFSLFLKFIFINKLRYSTEKSAVLAMYLGSLLAKQGQEEYIQMAYGDSQSGTFKWREVTEDAGVLKFV